MRWSAVWQQYMPEPQAKRLENCSGSQEERGTGLNRGTTVNGCAVATRRNGQSPKSMCGGKKALSWRDIPKEGTIGGSQRIFFFRVAPGSTSLSQAKTRKDLLAARSNSRGGPETVCLTECDFHFASDPTSSLVRTRQSG